MGDIDTQDFTCCSYGLCRGNGRSPGATSHVQNLVTSGLSTPWGIALDLAAEKMYWTDKTNAKIQRADLDGGRVEGLIKTGLTFPESFALDLVAGKMYWVDKGTLKIQRADLDGGNVEDLITSG